VRSRLTRPKSTRALAAAAAGVLTVSVASLVGATPASGAPTAPNARAAAAQSKVPWLLRERAAAVRSAVARGGTLSAAAAHNLSDGMLGIRPNGALDVVVHATGQVGRAEAAQLAALGATVRSSSADFASVRGVTLPSTGMISASIPADRLDAVAALPWVAALRPAIRPAVDVGPIEAEGVPLHRADVAQRLGITGRGQRVGAMSDGVTHLADSVAQGELPPDVQVLDPGDGDEGTGMLELVHDVAPGAKLLFSGTGETLEDHVAGLRNLAAAGATIITEDLAFDDEPAFQQGLAATTGDALARSGVFVSSSAGNLGARHAPRVTAVGTGRTPDDVAAEGNFASCPHVPHNLVDVTGTADDTFDVRLGAGGAVLVTLQWSEPRAIFPTPGRGGFTDLNLYLLNAAGTDCLASSAAVQANGVGDTIEQLIWENTTGATANFKLAVDVQGTSSAVRPPLLDLRWRNFNAPQAPVDTPDRAGSLNPDSNYLGAATSAGAVNSSVSTDPAAVPVEPFSAGGPVQVGLTTQCPGGRVGPCQGVPGDRFRTKLAPTWTAADGESISGAGGFPNPAVCPTTVQGQCRFFGTSAAAPTAAGVAALVRQELGGGLPPATLDLAMSLLSVDRGEPGPDNVWGAGVLQAVPSFVH
jgi:Subtilase family